MDQRRLGRTGPLVSTIAFGAFKIGRNRGTKYAEAYELPGDDDVRALLRGVLDLGIDCIDTAPAYGISEQRVGDFLAGAHPEIVISTKVGETFDERGSTYDFSAAAVRASVVRSLRRLQRDVLDLVYVHSDGRDRVILEQTDVAPTLQSLREEGLVKQIGFSGKTPDGATAALAWADVLMVEYHPDDRTHEDVIATAAARGVGIAVKKPLASGRHDPEAAIRFGLSNPGGHDARDRRAEPGAHPRERGLRFVAEETPGVFSPAARGPATSGRG